jgi:hypothetical protein
MEVSGQLHVTEKRIVFQLNIVASENIKLTP